MLVFESKSWIKPALIVGFMAGAAAGSWLVRRTSYDTLTKDELLPRSTWHERSDSLIRFPAPDEGQSTIE